jgi:YHS domain-containing protein
MKKTVTVALTVLALFCVTFAAALAYGWCGKPACSSKDKVASAVCPVQGNNIPDVTKAAAKSVYKGKTYYFCCKGCKPRFDKDPDKYIKEQKK